MDRPLIEALASGVAQALMQPLFLGVTNDYEGRPRQNWAEPVILPLIEALASQLTKDPRFMDELARIVTAHIIPLGKAVADALPVRLVSNNRIDPLLEPIVKKALEKHLEGYDSPLKNRLSADIFKGAHVCVTVTPAPAGGAGEKQL